MKKTIAVLLILALVFTLGCAAKTTQTQKTGTTKTTTQETTTGTTAQTQAAAGTTAAAVSDLDSELAEIDDLDEEFLSTELDNLDSELDFEI